MWEVIKESRVFQSASGPIAIEALGVRRDDGFTVLREVNDDWPYFEKSGEEAFSAQGKLGKFKFVANRRECGKQKSTYKISLVHSEAADAELTRLYAKDIESAFIEGWPWEMVHQRLIQVPGLRNLTYVPLEEVAFYASGILGPLRAEELDTLMFTRGFDKEFDLSQRDSERWQLVSQHRTYRTAFELDEVTRTYDILGVKQDNGFIMTLEGITEDRTEIFLCAYKNDEFRFSLKRWSMSSRGDVRVNPKYLLSLYWFYPNWPGNKPNNIELCHTYYKEIELALLNFPLMRMFLEYTPINEIAFEMDESLISSAGVQLND